MSELVVVLQDWTPGAGQRAAPGAERLPALEALLNRPLDDSLGWRTRLAARYAHEPLSVAERCALAMGIAPAGGRWLATPVHCQLGAQSAWLHAAGLLELSASERVALVTGFNESLGAGEWTLVAGSAREWLLCGSAPAGGGCDPALLLGRDPVSGWPSGPGSERLRRLASEVEMWLHDHPVNRARRERGELTVTGLWFWDEPGAASPTPRAARFYGRDGWLEALLGPPAGDAAASLPAIGSDADTLIAMPTMGEADLPAMLSALERRWLQPASAALARNALSAIELLAGANAWRRVPSPFWRRWQRGEPWWQRLP